MRAITTLIVFVVAAAGVAAGAGCGKEYNFGDAGEPDLRSGGGGDGGGGAEDLTMTSSDMTVVQRPCTVQKLEWAGDPAAYEASGTQVVITGGSASATQAVSVVVQSYPKQAVMKATLNWAPRADCSNASEVAMRFDKEVSNNDQWVGDIPPQAAGTEVCFYLKLTSCGGMDVYVSNNSQNYHYATK